MLRPENRCSFRVTQAFAGLSQEPWEYYGYIVTFRESDNNFKEFNGVLCPYPYADTGWVLIPMDKVTITRHPQEPIIGAGFETDE